MSGGGTFEELGLMPELVKAVDKLGWNLPTPIQQEAMPLILGGGDVLAAAETGSGKTGAFALPALQIVHEHLQQKAQAAASAGGGAGGGGGGGGKKGGAVENARLSVEDRDALLAVSEDGLICQSRAERAWSGGRATVGAVSGRHYWEMLCRDEGLCRVGWATKAAVLDLGTDKHGFGYGGTGKKSNARKFDPYGTAYGAGDYIGCLLDCDAHTVSYTRNGADLGVAFEIPKFLHGQALYPAVALKNAELICNFGDAPFHHPPPGGYAGIANAAPHQVRAGGGAAPAAPKGGGGGGGGRKPMVLILEPARDLAEQTAVCVRDFSKYLEAPRIDSMLMVGGTETGSAAKALRDGVEIVTGTPGRIIDFVESGKLHLDQIIFFILDEADRLLDTGNQDVIMKLYARLPKQGAGNMRLQVLMFSATLHSPEISELSQKLCVNPTWVDLKGKDAVPETVDHFLVRVSSKKDTRWGKTGKDAVVTDGVHNQDKAAPGINSPESLSEGIKRLKPMVLKDIIDKHNMEQCLIFCRTNVDCDNLEQYMVGLGGGRAYRGKAESGKENPYSCVVLAGMRSMQERRINLQAFKDGDVRFMICTDVAARGLDIKELPYVINVTLPDKAEDYIHRVGRVGRADTMGLAISIVAEENEKVWFHKCPNRGRGCSDARLVDQGGCAIWYNEPALLEAVEKRLGGHSITPLDKDLSLPGGGTGAKYGQARQGSHNEVSAKHMEQLRPSVRRLAELETLVQYSFLNLKRKWAVGDKA